MVTHKFPYIIEKHPSHKVTQIRCNKCKSKYVFQKNELTSAFNMHQLIYSRFSNEIYMIDSWYETTPPLKEEIEFILSFKDLFKIGGMELLDTCPYCGDPLGKKDMKELPGYTIINYIISKRALLSKPKTPLRTRISMLLVKYFGYKRIWFKWKKY